MRVVVQDLDTLVSTLSPLDVDWMDDIAASAIARLKGIPPKNTYTTADVQDLFDTNFEEGLLCARLFLALSKDGMTTALKAVLGDGIGAKRYASDKTVYLDALVGMGLLEKMEATINYQPVWSDILAERLRSGRGSAIQGQKRGRGLEDFAEKIVQQVFGDSGYATRCTFTGANGSTAKCDIAIPDKAQPRIVLESKGLRCNRLQDDGYHWRCGCHHFGKTARLSVSFHYRWTDLEVQALRFA